jgi:hypothetical protein
MKAKNILHAGYGLIILQLLAYYGAKSVAFLDVDYSIIDSKNFGYFIASSIASNLFLFLGLLLIVFYLLKYKKPKNPTNESL